MATSIRTTKKNWLKAAVFTFVAVDCLGIYIAEKKLSEPVPDTLSESPLAMAEPASPTFSPSAKPLRLEFVVPQAQEQAAPAPAPVQMARAEVKPVAPAVVAPNRAVPAANPLIAPRMVEARTAQARPAAMPAATPAKVAPHTALAVARPVAAPKPARIEIPHPTFASAVTKAQVEHHVAHRAIERPIVPTVHVERHARHGNAFANAFANGIGSLAQDNVPPPVQVSIAPVQSDGLLPVAPPPAEPELPAVQLGVTSAPATPGDAAPASQSPAQVPAAEGANPRI